MFFFFFYHVIRDIYKKFVTKDALPEFLSNYFASNWKAVDRDLSASTWPPLSGPISSRFGAENTKLANTESTNDRDCTWTIVPRFPRNFFLPPHMLKTLGVHLTQIHTLSLFFFLFFFSLFTEEHSSKFQYINSSIHVHSAQLPFPFIEPIILLIDRKSNLQIGESPC